MRMKHLAMAAGLMAGLSGLAGTAQADGGDGARGKALFAQCSACHAYAPGAAARMGPNLYGVAGRKAGTVAGFHYTPALAKSGLTWNDATLDKWLTAPMKLVPGTMMAFGGVAKPADRAALIAYLKSGKP